MLHEANTSRNICTGVEAAQRRLAAHTGALSEVIEHAETSLGIQAFIASHLIFFQTGLWYFGASWASLVVSSTPRTIGARLPIIAILAGSLAVEWHLTSRWETGLASGASPGRFRLGKWHVTTLGMDTSWDAGEGEATEIHRQPHPHSSRLLAMAYAAGWTLQDACSAVRWTGVLAAAACLVVSWYMFDDAAASTKMMLDAVDSKVGLLAQLLSGQKPFQTLSGNAHTFPAYEKERIASPAASKPCVRTLHDGNFDIGLDDDADDADFDPAEEESEAQLQSGGTLLSRQVWQLSLQGGNLQLGKAQDCEPENDSHVDGFGSEEDVFTENAEVLTPSPGPKRSRSPHVHRRQPIRAAKSEAANRIKQAIFEAEAAENGGLLPTSLRNLESVGEFCGSVAVNLARSIMARRHRDELLGEYFAATGKDEDE